ncbi:MAG TPA: glycoside hydrolase family 97 catalytic domain-containing protein [Polyangiaceae bacterium LLY-WYZ-15_(1-7)]|nr:glycoside hydrolase family 97 catalytic domain-containing protein [Polyangiaceae bacterium LLY-WYZ-15_(1-7)]HJL04681.1 glycoside hydrolase family 97 catalytic domain-containing protein [Polyangiaceae bacterium LLY-WYZ-15_(1-7)]HJL09682.1 glycoside hydrolase family 97 catalytic domain-containing protein [Polyangiaceae bacterium LLY-WYZ-15_(1-7)]HJL34075.1 glycoside hydrolase family 97 catalytic domain-containing protein [Polyangiaceae bacterium LLY-WYZ-15_(1-7)]
MSSPDGALTIEVVEDQGALAYRVLDDGIEVVALSPLGLETDAGPLGARVVGEATRIVEESYAMPHGKRRERAVRGNELVLELAGAVPGALVLRAHDDGVAFRYRLEGEGEVRVKGEATGFDLPAGEPAWLLPYDEGALFAGSYEATWVHGESGDAGRGRGWAFPALFALDGESRWVMITESDLDGAYAGTRLDETPVVEGGRTRYGIRFPSPIEGGRVGEVEPRSARPFATPWRVLLIGDRAEVVESTLVEDLARPTELEDTDWIRPGRAAWSWPTQLTGDVAQQRAYLAFAERVGWEHVLVDANWTDWEDAEAVVPAFVAEAAEAGVSVWLWYNSGGEHNGISEAPRDRMSDPEVRRAEMARIAGWGVAGIKVDFFQSDKQDRVQQYLAILEDAGEAQLMVNLHGCTAPRGWARTHPYLMTMEAIRGAEFYLFPSGPRAEDHVRYVFTRNVIGAMDYTPVILEPALEKNDLGWAHQLALAVLFESGVQHFAGRADGSEEEGFAALFAAYPFVERFFAEVPAAWDETVLLAGHPETHAVLARRRGEVWWVAGVTVEARELELELGRLGEGPFEVTRIEEGATADALVESSEEALDRLSVSLPARGGFVATLR